MNKRKLKARLKTFLRYKLRIELSRIPKRGDEKFPGHIDPAFPPLFRKYAHFTMVPWQGLYWSWLAAQYVRDHDIPGDVVECGVYRGGCSLIMAEGCNRNLWMYDTYAGMPEPSEQDFKGVRKGDRFDAKQKYRQLRRNGYVDWCYGSFDVVQAAVRSSGLEFSRFRLIRGKVEETIPGNAPEQIALLRLDTDFYESTRHELEHLYPRLASRGLMLIDDYGAWAGARKAVDDYISGLNPKPLCLPESFYGALLVIKP